MYSEGDYDLAGFAIGAVERGKVLTSVAAAAGDIVLGLASAGLHSNGFSLVRRVVAATGADLQAPAPFDDARRLGDALLEPTRIYVKSCLDAARAGGVKAFAHITGGGLIDNVPRVLPENTVARLEAAAWEIPAVFRWLASAGGVAVEDMGRTFNCGIGMVLVCAPDDTERLSEILRENGEAVSVIGRIEAGSGEAACVIEGAEIRWRG